MKFFRYIWLACTGLRTYAEFLPLSLRQTAGYWAGVSFCLSVVLMLNLAFWFHEAMPKIEKAAANLPAFGLTNSHAYSTLPQPYFANTNQFPIILDLKGTIPHPEKMFENGLVIREQTYGWWIEHSSLNEKPWVGWPDGEVNQSYLKNLEQLTYRIWPFFLLVFWFAFFALGFVQAYFFTFTTSFLERGNPVFTFNEVFNLALFSLTPAVVIVATYASWGLTGIHYGLLYFMVFTFFFIMSYGACRHQMEPPHEDESGDE